MIIMIADSYEETKRIPQKKEEDAAAATDVHPSLSNSVDSQRCDTPTYWQQIGQCTPHLKG